MSINDLPCIGCDTQEGCGTGMGNWPKPGDPDNNSILRATPAFGGVDVSWTYPLTNPFAVQHTLLFRSLSSDFNTASQIAVVSGNFFHDQNYATTPVRYYYWIQIVSVHGTYGEVIGPESAVPNPTIDDMLVMLTGKIDAGVLAQSLKEDIDRIEINAHAIIKEVDDRFQANVALSNALAQVQNHVDGAVTYINQEIVNRVDGQDALLQMINTMAVGNGELAAAIVTEREARIEGDTVLARDVTTLFTKNSENEAGLIAERTARVDADTAMASDIVVLKADVGDNKAAIQQEATVRSTADSAQVDMINNLAATVTTNNTTLSGLITDERTARISADQALVTQINTVGAAAETNSKQYATAIVRDEATARIDGDYANAVRIQTVQSTLGSDITSVETKLETTTDKVTGIGALYTAKVSVNGLVGGFGVYNNGTSIEAGFDVDNFWVGKTMANRKKPFIITGGVVYMNTAVIEDLSVGRLKITSYPFNNGSVNMVNGVAEVTITHNLGRNVLPVVLWNTSPTSNMSLTLTFEDTSRFGFRMNAFELTGAGYNGTVYYQYMYL